MLNRRTMIWGTLSVALAGRAFAQSRVQSIWQSAVGNARTAAEKVRSVIAWTHNNLEWTDTDYENRTPEQILERGGGNCYEQATVVRALLEPAGVDMRLTREINIQPADSGRQQRAEEMVRERGNSLSVFGERHNDHVWNEYYDAEWGQWVPADPTLNVVGTGDWVRARLGFEGRPVHEIIPYADMLFPIAVVVPLGEGQYERRSDKLLIEGFANYIPGVWTAPQWPDWVRLVRTAEDHLIGALRNEYNMHQDNALREEMIATYGALKADWLSRHSA